MYACIILLIAYGESLSGRVSGAEMGLVASSNSVDQRTASTVPLANSIWVIMERPEVDCRSKHVSYSQYNAQNLVLTLTSLTTANKGRRQLQAITTAVM